MRSLDIAATFGREGIEYERRADGDTLRVRCPFHDDTSPSCDVSQSNQQFICRACNAHGGVIALLVRLLGKPRHVILSSLRLTTDKPVEASVVLRYHSQIWSATSLLTELRNRGVSDETIKKYYLGEFQGRITIPVSNETGMYVNIRQYLPGAAEFKTINLKGRGSVRLYPFDQLGYDKILLTGGEVKALAGAQRLNEHGIGCVALTSSEAHWNDEFDDYFEGKHVWVGLDIDAAGRQGADFKCRRLATVAEWVGRIDWPLDIKQHPKGDLNDYVVQPGADLLGLLNAATRWESPATADEIQLSITEDQAPIEVSVKDAYSSTMVDKRFKTSALIVANGQDSYFLPKTIRPRCDQRQDNCSTCPIFGSKPDMTVTISAENEHLLTMMDTDSKSVKKLMRESAKIPECPIVEFDVVSKYQVSEMRVQEALDLSRQDLDNTSMPTTMIGVEVDLNETYRLVGKTVSHPKTQKGVAIVSGAEKVADALRGFDLKQPEQLLRFRPSEWSVEAISSLLDEFYREMSHNVTQIYDRQEMHIAVDLVYHSMLTLPIGTNTQRGITEVLVVGDNEQGKSFTAARMMDFYGLGEKVDSKNASVAGLVGGLEQIAGKWYVQWGVWPRHDRRMILLEELKGMPIEMFAKLTEVRSSGRAELPKIIRRFAPARVRLLALSNGRKKANLSDYSYGVYALKELIGSPEDLRRFDLGLVISREDLRDKVVNETRPHISETFSSDMCRRLILWCWTRTPEQTHLPLETVNAAVKAADRLTAKYVDDIPLLGKAGTKYKLLRLAAAMAGRTFSATPDFSGVIVRPSHVEWVADFIDAQYSKSTHGYAAMSASLKKKASIEDEALLIAALQALPHAEVVLDRLLSTDDISKQDLADWIGWTGDEVDLLVSRLVRSNAIKRHERDYRKTGPFLELLRTLKVSRPAHIPTTEPSHAY